MKYLKMISAFAVAIGIACSAHGASGAQLGAKIERVLAMILPSKSAVRAGEPPECYDKYGNAVYSYKRCELLAREEANPACNSSPPGQCNPGHTKPGTCRDCTSDPDPGP
jgi:hypothetical protein